MDYDFTEIKEFRKQAQARWKAIANKFDYEQDKKANRILEKKLFYIDEIFEAIDMGLSNPLYD